MPPRTVSLKGSALPISAATNAARRHSAWPGRSTRRGIHASFVRLRATRLQGEASSLATLASEKGLLRIHNRSRRTTLVTRPGNVQRQRHTVKNHLDGGQAPMLVSPPTMMGAATHRGGARRSLVSQCRTRTNTSRNGLLSRQCVLLGCPPLLGLGTRMSSLSATARRCM